MLAPGEMRRIARFILVGGGLFALDFGIFAVMVQPLAIDPVWAQPVANIVRAIVGFFAHKWFTFAGDSADGVAKTAGQGLVYGVQAAVNVPISTAVVVGCIWVLGGWELGGKLLSEVVMIAEVYLLYRFLVFGGRLFGRGLDTTETVEDQADL